MAAKGWLKGEPEEPEPEKPELIPLSLDHIEQHFKTSPVEVAARLGWKPVVFEQVAGVSLTITNEHPEKQHARVVQLDLIRAERSGARRRLE